jgi:hypothetical protein
MGMVWQRVCGGLAESTIGAQLEERESRYRANEDVPARAVLPTALAVRKCNQTVAACGDMISPACPKPVHSRQARVHTVEK